MKNMEHPYFNARKRAWNICRRVILLMTIFLSNVSADHLADEAQVLIDVKSLWGDPNVLVRWSQTLDTCGWPFVTCDTQNTNILGVSIDKRNLSGPVPSLLGSLDTLTTLTLSNNFLNGSIPDSLGNLSNLTLLDLSFNNYLNGPIPDSFGNLSQLSTLNLKQNSFQGQIPESLGSLSKLSVLDLSFNNFSGHIPNSFGNLSQLSEFSLRNNLVEGPLLANLGNLTKLSNLTLPNNRLEGVIPDSLGNLVLLSKLDLGYNRLNGSIPESFSNFTQLASLYLAHNRLSGSISPIIGNFPKLTYIYARNNTFDGPIPDTFAMHILHILDLSMNLLDGPIPESLTQSSPLNLQLLNISHNQLSGVIPPSLWNNGQLQTVDLHSNNLDGALPSPPSPSNLTQLTYMDLSDNRLNGTLPSGLSGLGSLTYLNLSRNNFDGGIDYLETLSNLQTLSLDGNPFNSNILNVSSLSQLQTLSLRNCSLTGEVPSSVTSLTSLKYLNMTDNQLTGADWKIFGLPNLIEAMLDRNIISGQLDLSIWHASLKAGLNQANRSVFFQVFSLVNNSITDIKPRLRDMEEDIQTMLIATPREKLDNIILLGGNPWCNNPRTFAQEYLCRYDKADFFQSPTALEKKSNQRLAIIVGTSVGAGALFIGCISFAILWRLWRKEMDSLREIQIALAHQRVQPPFFDYKELKVATRDFHPDNKLGQGAFGDVHKGVLPDGTLLAVKRLFNPDQVMSDFLNEMVLITGIKHKNLVHLKGCCIKDKKRILVYEYVERGNLSEALWDCPGDKILSWENRLSICVGIARGLSYLHEELQPCIIHRDIKPANILLDKNLCPKIADFGLARVFPEEESLAEYTHVAGTKGYFAPEYALHGQLTEKADVFSFGIIVLEMVSGRKCIDHKMPQGQVVLKDWAETLYKKGMAVDLLQPELRESVIDPEEIKKLTGVGLLCAQSDPQMRPSMSHVVTMLLGSVHVTVLTKTAETFFVGSNPKLEEGDSSSLLSNDIESLSWTMQFGEMSGRS